MQKMEFKIKGSLRCKVDTMKIDCNEPAHCHIPKKSSRVAKVWLNVVSIEPGHYLTQKEMDIVVDAVSKKRLELIKVYNHNHEFGS